MRRTGIRFHHQGAVELLKKAGAFVSDGTLVKFPASLVEQALGSAPSRIIMCDRDGQPGMYLEGSKVYFGTGSDCLNLLDPRTGQHRKFVEADPTDAYRLCDALPNIHFVMSVGIPFDVNRNLDLRRPDAAHAGRYHQADRVCDQRPGQLPAGDRYGGCSCGRLRCVTRTAAYPALFRAQLSLAAVGHRGGQVDHDGGVRAAGSPFAGSADGRSCADHHGRGIGDVAGRDPEQPGGPPIDETRRAFRFWSRHPPHGHERHADLYASPEFQLTKAAIAELGRWYGLPTWGYAGCSDAKVMDEQAAVEATLSVIMAKFSGGNLIDDVGYMESGLTTSYEMIALTDELVAMTDNMVKGIEVNDETLLVDEIDRVGPRRQLPGLEGHSQTLP